MQIEVSVIMAVYNGAKYLNESIESILNQTYKNFEFIIIDDGSSDNTKEIVKSYKDSRIILLEQENSGPAIARNNAIKHSTGEFVAIIDSDDISMPERLELQLAFLTKNPDFVLVGSNAHVIDMDGEYVYTSNLPLAWEDILSKFPSIHFFHSSVMYKKETFYMCQGYYEELSRFKYSEDALLWNRMKNYGKMGNLELPLIKYRLVPNAISPKSGRESKIVNQVYKELVTENYLSKKNKELLENLKRNITEDERKGNYYIHLAKKYLFNNYQPQKARNNICLALKTDSFHFIGYMLYLFTILPKVLIMKIYRINKF